MRFMHLSDLHIGKRVNEFSMLEDQEYIFNQILELAESSGVDGVWIAGDIYDKSTPSAEAVRLFDRFLTDLAGMGKQVFLISGNHDSPERLAFGGRLMEGRGVYISPVYQGCVAPVELEDEYGKLNIYLLPFLKPAQVRHVFPGEQVETYQDAVRLAVEVICGRACPEGMEKTACWNPDIRNVLLAHQFVTGALRCESEELSVGGVDQVAGETFSDFDYVALGHIHNPQHVGREAVRYCGTPLKYSFSEADFEKSVTIVDLKAKGETEISTIPLRPLRDMRRIRGSYMELTDRSRYLGTNVEDYLQVTLTDQEDVPEAMGKLRSIYPNIMKLEYDNARTRTRQEIESSQAVEEKTPLQLFEELYRLQNNQDMSQEQRELARDLIGQIWEGGEA